MVNFLLVNEFKKVEKYERDQKTYVVKLNGLKEGNNGINSFKVRGEDCYFNVWHFLV